MILTGLGLAAASAARSLLEVYAAYGLGVGLGVGCAYVPAIGAVQRWFVRRRGFASGLAVSGIGVGTLVMPPLASLLIESLGWRGAYLVLGALAVVVGGGLALLIENDPATAALARRRSAAAGRATPARPEGARCAKRSGPGRFISLYAACLICSFGVFVPFVHLVPYALDHGVAATVGGVAARRDRRRQHRRTLLPRRPRRPDGPPILAAADVCRHGARTGDLGVLDRISGRSPPSRSSTAYSTADGSRCFRPW